MHVPDTVITLGICFEGIHFESQPEYTFNGEQRLENDYDHLCTCHLPINNLI
jgi:hypothetical protein